MTQNLQGWLKEYTLLIYEDIDSTNEEAKRLAREGIGGSYAIWAKSQKQGHGRYGRNWVSPEGNLYLSLLLHPECDVEAASQVVFVAAAAMADTLSFFLPSSAEIGYKWPNDIMVNGKKAGGILLESHMKVNSREVDWLVVGVGINLGYYPELLAERTGYEATSLRAEGVEAAEVDDVLYKFMQSFTQVFGKWKDKGFIPLKEQCMKHALNLGKVITVCTTNDRLSGVFQEINEQGCLVLTLEGGHQKVISVGEVFFGAKQGVGL